MASWIKMQTNLWNAPQVVRLMSVLNADKVCIIGGLFRTWSLGDEYTANGRLAFYTPGVLDSEVGLPGWSAALEAVGWLIIEPEALVIPEFEQHNGQSAKRRAQEARRKETVRKTSASDAGKKRTRSDKSRASYGGSSDEERPTNGSPGGEEGPSAEAIDWNRAHDTARAIRSRIYPGDMPPDAGPVLLKLAALSQGALPGAWLPEFTEATAEAMKRAPKKRPKHPAKYLRTCLANRSKKDGIDLAVLLDSIEIPPHKPTPQPEPAVDPPAPSPRPSVPEPEPLGKLLGSADITEAMRGRNGQPEPAEALA